MKLKESLKNYQSVRRLFLFIVILIIFLQFFRLKILVGSFTGSVFLFWINLLDPYAFLEIHFASKEINTKAIVAVIPIVVLYIIFGRAFCGWICPMDYLFQLINKIKFPLRSHIAYKISPKYGYFLFISFLILSFFLGVPLFTNYFSHLTNFFRTITGIYFLILNMPVDLSLVIYSFFFIFVLLLFELFLPHFWCRLLCPVGKIYGLMNKISLLHLAFDRSKCLNCKVCNKSCYMGIELTKIMNKDKMRNTDCIFCGKCIDSCKEKGNVIKFKIGV